MRSTIQHELSHNDVHIIIEGIHASQNNQELLKCIDESGASVAVSKQMSNYKSAYEAKYSPLYSYNLNIDNKVSIEEYLNDCLSIFAKDPALRSRPYWLSTIIEMPEYNHLADCEIITLLIREYTDFVVFPSYFKPRSSHAMWSFGKEKHDFSNQFIWKIQAIGQQFLVKYYSLLIAPTKKVTLTDRESSVLELIAAGKTNPEIAIILGIKPSTVATYVKTIYLKFDTSDRVSTSLKAFAMDSI